MASQHANQDDAQLLVSHIINVDQPHTHTHSHRIAARPAQQRQQSRLAAFVAKCVAYAFAGLIYIGLRVYLVVLRVKQQQQHRPHSAANRLSVVDADEASKLAQSSPATETSAATPAPQTCAEPEQKQQQRSHEPEAKLAAQLVDELVDTLLKESIEEAERRKCAYEQIQAELEDKLDTHGELQAMPIGSPDSAVDSWRADSRLADNEEEYYCTSDADEEAADERLIMRYDAIQVPQRAHYGQTLVCALSPSPDCSTCDARHSPSAMSSSTTTTSSCTATTNNSLDEDELALCRDTFRSTRPVFARGQRAQAMDVQVDDKSTVTVESLSSMRREATLERLSKRQERLKCSSCSERVYPVDKLKLDFARFSLTLHRCCFRCCVCQTQLRLDTYAADGSRLTCPAHTSYIKPANR